MHNTITGLQNPRIKNILLLQKKVLARKQQNLFVAEGLREIAMAFSSGFIIKELFVCRVLVDDWKLAEDVLGKFGQKNIYNVNTNVFNRIAYRETSGGMVALIEPQHRTLNDLTPGAVPFVIVLEAVEKPGNLGAVLRTADAAGVDAVIICDPATDLYNPNIIRSSLGCLFTNRVVVCTTEEAIRWLSDNGINTFAATPDAETRYYETDMTGSVALIFGAEATGLSGKWMDAAGRKIKIPMKGRADSLNVSVSAAILAFEVVRQRVKG